MLLNFGSVDVS